MASTLDTPVSPPPPPSTLVVEEGCGIEHHNQSCGYPYPCCSIHGHCGDSVYYCALGNCDSDFGTCWENVPPPPPSTPPPPPPPSTLAVEEGCGIEHHNQSCGYPYPCCRIHGQCGDSVYYCAPGNCDSNFGTCWENVPPPPPSTPPPPPSTLAVEEGCGIEHHNQSCGYPYPCCSIHGHCGDSVYYCAPGNCDHDFGTCWDNIPPPPPNTPPPPPPPSTLAVEEGCGIEHNNQTCGYPYPCCSIHGHFGDNVYYCAPRNCDSNFGSCLDNIPPPPPSTNPPPPPSQSAFEEGCGPEHHEQSCGYPYPCCSKEGHCGDNAYYCGPGNCLFEYGICWPNVPPPPEEMSSDDNLIGEVLGEMELLNKF